MRDLSSSRRYRSLGNQRLSQPGAVQRRFIDAALGIGYSTGRKMAGIQGAASKAERLSTRGMESAAPSKADNQTFGPGRRPAIEGGSASDPVRRAGIPSAGGVRGDLRSE